MNIIATLVATFAVWFFVAATINAIAFRRGLFVYCLAMSLALGGLFAWLVF